MKFSLLAAIITAEAVCAKYQAFEPRAGQPLLPRDFGDGVCVIGSTCTQCFGAGYIICDKIGCFNPGEHQQCCKDAAICVGSTDACCKDYGGKGVPGSSGAPIAPTTTTSANAPSWTCTKADSGEDCCRRGGNDLHYCGGEFPNQRCFNSKLQWCCTDGTVCDEKNCCQDLFTLSTTEPWKAQSTKPGSSQTTSRPDSTTAMSSSSPQSTSKSAGSSSGLRSRGLVGCIGVVLGVCFLP